MAFLLLLNQVCFPRVPLIGCRQVQPLTNYPTIGPFPMDSLHLRGGAWKEKVVFVLGATGTGKSRLAIDLATHFGAEIVNSDKMQVYDGLDVVTNKVTEEECAGIPHHLLGGVHPDADFTASDFRRQATLAVESIIDRGRVPIIAGGSNSYIEALVDGDRGEFRSKYECCFLWVDVSLPELHAFVAERVDRMVELGLVQEVREMFDPEADYSRGIRRAIGVPEMDRYLRAERKADEATRGRMLEEAIDEIKVNTCKLSCCQLQKIDRLCRLSGWDVHRLDATEVFRRRGKGADEAWEKLVGGPSIRIVERFLDNKGEACSNEATVTSIMESGISAATTTTTTNIKIVANNVAVVGATV